jgi:ATP-dependent protease ClpP protease subunit
VPAVQHAGRDVSEGIYLYNMLRAYPFRLVIHSVGDVESVGTAVFLVSDVRYACPASKFMLHGVSRSFWRPGRDLSLTAEELRWALVNVTADEERISSIISQRSALAESEIAVYFREQRRLTADEAAAAAGIVHEVKEARIPQGSVIITVDPDQ